MTIITIVNEAHNDITVELDEFIVFAEFLLLKIVAFDKGERLHSAVAFENFGAFIDTDLLPPQRIPQGRNYSGKMT